MRRGWALSPLLMICLRNFLLGRLRMAARGVDRRVMGIFSPSSHNSSRRMFRRGRLRYRLRDRCLLPTFRLVRLSLDMEMRLRV